MIKYFIAVLFLTFSLAENSLSFTANKVWFERTPKGGYRVVVGYTIPDLKVYREAVVEFAKKTEAESFYWDVVSGADFYIKDKMIKKYRNPPLEPQPW